MSNTSAQSDITFVDSEASLLLLLDSIANLPTEPPSLYMDMEGIKLGRHGSISILSLYIAPTEKTYLVDVHTVKETAFSTTNSNGTSLKTVLESPDIPKVVFDIRNDSDALFSHFQIYADGIKDLQVMELATRKYSQWLVASLTKCIKNDSPISPIMKIQWIQTKDRGRSLFAPEEGGSFEVFNERPLKPELMEYCQKDTSLLPGLYSVYNAKLQAPNQAFWRVHVRGATKDRILLSRSPRYDGHSAGMSLGWLDWMISDAEVAWASGGDIDEDDRRYTALGDDGLEDDYDDGSARDCAGWEDDMVKNGEDF
ncbi:hypothetical protein VF21_06920 [Pseudogymnoascus sp. 05NY08]|nr:hypothetical protein VF21_06920 [Pseudogymnoascus sp. 05NY08]